MWSFSSGGSRRRVFGVKQPRPIRLTCAHSPHRHCWNPRWRRPPCPWPAGWRAPLDGICLSESDKTAVLTLIREEVKASPPRRLLLISLSSLCASREVPSLLAWVLAPQLESSYKGLPVKQPFGAGVLAFWCPRGKADAWKCPWELQDTSLSLILEVLSTQFSQLYPHT